ncbi:hypothetical protein AAVH_04688 [Aphelenchoides avenae]|nr:hypothetical protein AAVH_04688 [Aphelenchus avenae]
MASSPTRIRQRPTELSQQLVAQSQLLSPTRTFKPRAYASVAHATLPLSGCRVRVTEEGTRRYKFKIADPVASDRRPSTMDVRRYLKSVHSARETFFREAATKSLSPALLPEYLGDIKWTRAAPRDEILRWKDTSSIGYSTTVTDPPQKKKGKTKKKDNVAVNTQEDRNDVPLESIPFLRCIELEYDVDVDVPRAFESIQVSDLAADVSAPTVPVPPPGEIASPEHREQLTQFKEKKRQREKGHMIFCGGPISALRTCPRKLPNGK